MDIETEAAELRSTLRTRDTEIACLKAECAQTMRDADELGRENARLTRELDEARESLERERGVCAGCGESGPKTCCACYQTEVKAWRDQFHTLRARAEQAEEQLRLANIDATTNEAEANDLRAERDALKQIEAAALTKITDLTAERDEARRDAEMQRRVVADAQADVERLDAERDRLRGLLREADKLAETLLMCAPSLACPGDCGKTCGACWVRRWTDRARAALRGEDGRRPPLEEDYGATSGYYEDLDRDDER